MFKFINFIKLLVKKLSSCEFFTYRNVMHYISSGEALPNALTDEEEKEYISMLGGEQDEFAKKKLIEHN